MAQLQYITLVAEAAVVVLKLLGKLHKVVVVMEAELVQHKVLVQLLTEAAVVAAALEEILLEVVAV
tara:strand:- start:53 stop:250 length:198 start_codon:yes stop_codon:yes gene_type:complete